MVIGGLIDLTLFGIMQGNEKTSWLWIPVVGVVYFVVYYFVFSFMIRKFNYMTPGRDNNAEAKLYTRKDLEARKKAGEVTEAEAADELSAQITQGLGGKDNISDVDCCITRLRCTVKDPAKVDQQLLKSTGASGVLCKGQGVQVVYGPRVSVIKSDLEAYLKSSASDHPAPVAKPAQEAKPVETKPADAPKAGGERLTVVSPLAGKIIPVEEVADGVFSEKMVGDGFAVEPEADEVLAPADGEITLVFDTKHAFTMRTAHGVDLLVHMGIDTIRLNGEPFTLSIKQGDVVKAGQPIGTMDRAAILAAGYRTVTPVVVGNLADLGGFELTRTGEVKAGDAVMEVF